MSNPASMLLPDQRTVVLAAITTDWRRAGEIASEIKAPAGRVGTLLQALADHDQIERRYMGLCTAKPRTEYRRLQA